MIVKKLPVAWGLTALSALLLLAGCAGTTAIQADSARDAGASSVLFFADPQIHNIYGGGVRQTKPEADLAAGVARRHPETNLLARYAMQDLIERGTAQLAPSDPALVVVLGDATNAACTGEFQRFMDSAAKAKGKRVMLMAHGNHDSFLMGTINYWQSMRDPARLVPFRDAPFPVDATWWDTMGTPTHQTSSGWRALCYQSAAVDSTPMHKIQWLAKYMDSLTGPDAGLELTQQGSANGRTMFSGHGKPGSPLAATNFALKGEWIRPDAAGDGLQKTYDSFIVQAVDIGTTHRLVLVDTSACASWPAQWYLRRIRYAAQNAGVKGCMQERQIDLIRSMVQDSRSSGRHVVFAGHFPLADILSRDKDLLIRLMEETSGPRWTYLSAHTHDPMDVRTHGSGAQEINMGSTTDWPMAAHRIRFGSTIVPTPVGVPEPIVAYKASPVFPTGPELCRHVEAAEALRDLDPSLDLDRPGATYTSPGNMTSFRACIDKVDTAWSDYEQRLQMAEAAIDARMADPRYKQRMLSIMAAASLHESGQFALVKWFSGVVR